MTREDLVSGIEGWFKTSSARALSCVRNYQPGFAPYACDTDKQCIGCLMIAAHLELARSSAASEIPPLRFRRWDPNVI